MHTRIRCSLTAVVLGSLASGLAGAQASDSLQDARRHWLDANVNVLTFHSIDQLFPTRRVERSGTPWVLPHVERKLDFSYEYDGKKHAALDVETCVLGWVLERATKQNLAQFMTEWLGKPAGVESHGFWMLDGAADVGREFAGEALMRSRATMPAWD